VRWLGVRWAAKEAAFKAGGVGRRLQWKEVEVRYMPSGASNAIFLGEWGVQARLKEVWGNNRTAVSAITKGRGYRRVEHQP